MVEAKDAEVPAAAPAAATAEALFQRRIEFHPARKPFSHISSSGGGFQLETLNPGGRDSHRPAPNPGGPAAAASMASGKRSDGGEFYEHGLDPELSFRITFRRIGAGLANLGNTCFLNSVLQCLTYTEPFAAYLQSGKHKSSCHTAGFCAMCALQNHVMNALQSTGKILSPSHLVKNLRCISRNFRNSRQEDAHEYMVNLLESMHKCCLPSGVPSESPSAYEKSLVHKIFGGRLRSQVKCRQCSYCSNKFDPFLDLSLEIMKADSLRKALAHFTAVEQLDGGERQYQCQRCKEKVRALKQLTIHKAPHVLTIHLKRFGSHIPGQKIDKKVEFEPTLDLKPFVSDSHEGNLKYTLYGVLVHAGWSTHSGHYYCFVRTSSGMWHNLDDNQVHQVSEKTVLAQKAYMLFYVRDSSSTVKKSIDVVHKESMSAIALAHKSKEAVQSALASKGAAQSTTAERRFCTSEFCPAKLRTDATSNGLCSSVNNTSSDKLLQEQASSLPNGKMKQNEASTLQTNGYVVQKEASYLLSNGEVLPKGYQNITRKHPSTLSSVKDPNMPVVTISCHRVSEDLMQPVQVVQGSIITNSEAKSGTLVAELDKAAVPKKTSEEHAKKLDMEKGVHKNGDTANPFVQSKDMDRKIDSENTPAKIEPVKLLKQLRPLNTSIQKEALGKVPVQHQKEALAEAGTEQGVGDCRQTDLKPKKRPKLKGMYFGRKELFLSALCLRKSKKLKVTKKRLLRSSRKNSVQDELNIDDQGASTSEAAKVVGADAKRSHRKRTRSNLNRGNDIKGSEDENCYIGSSINGADRGVEERNSKDSVMLATSEQPKRGVNSVAIHCNSRETDANDNSSLQRDFMNLLMRGLKEPSVAQWDDIELPKSELRGFGNSRNRSIGYVLDEWDEEYDRGRRKKVKQSIQSFGGPNLFQETANVKVQQKMMKLDHTRSGNQPFRI